MFPHLNDYFYPPPTFFYTHYKIFIDFFPNMFVPDRGDFLFLNAKNVKNEAAFWSIENILVSLL